MAHSAHAPLGPDDELVVVAVGTPDALASFRVGRGGPPIRMAESAPGT